MSKVNYTKVIVSDNSKKNLDKKNHQIDDEDYDDEFDDFEDRWNKNHRKVKVLKFKDSRSL